jgi:hypothetical protein
LILGSFGVRFDDTVLDQPSPHRILVPSIRDRVGSLVVVGRDEVLELVTFHVRSLRVVCGLLLDDPSSEFRVGPGRPEVGRSIVVYVQEESA